MRVIRWLWLFLLLALQYAIWVAPGGVVSYVDLTHKIADQSLINQQWRQQNAVLIADIADLKQGNEAIEERAREQLGMIKPGEIFYQLN